MTSPEVIISGYHKTGSRLFSKAFQAYRDRHPEFQFRRVWSFFNVSDQIIRTHRCAVIIRHPYEVIMSGARYHLHTREKYFNTPRTELNGLTYREHVGQLDVASRILFEIEQVGGHTVGRMYHDLQQRNPDEQVRFIQLEQLWNPENLHILCDGLANHLDAGISVSELSAAFSRTLRQNSNRTYPENRHSYPDMFKPVHYRAIRERFPDDLLKVLGYTPEPVP